MPATRCGCLLCLKIMSFTVSRMCSNTVSLCGLHFCWLRPLQAHIGRTGLVITRSICVRDWRSEDPTRGGEWDTERFVLAPGCRC
jgi:hypothetical protein